MENWQLHPEQDYLTLITRKLKIPKFILRHKKATSTCYEKANLLGWEPERVIKIIFFHHDRHVVGIVTPELGRINQKKILSRALGIPTERSKRYLIHSWVPQGMEYGTCTPFLFESSVGSEVHDIFVLDLPEINNLFVDVSLGGKVREKKLIGFLWSCLIMEFIKF